jgi:putative oxidoreductase
MHRWSRRSAVPRRNQYPATPVAISLPHWLATLAPIYARCALGAAFLSAVASRFGLWAGEPGLAAFDRFMNGYGAQTLSFVPQAMLPFLIWSATIAETTLGVALILGFQIRWVALASAVLLAMFGTAMAISFGPKSPLEYSVYSASAGALLLAVHHWPSSPNPR